MKPTQPELFPRLALPPSKAQPRKAPRVLMHVADAGDLNWRRWVCPACAHEVEIHHAEDPPNSYRRPCPVCPQPYEEADAYPPIKENR